MPDNPLNCWIITEGHPGTENQCLGVTEALNLSPVIMHVQLKQPWKIFSPYLGFEQSWSFKQKLSPPWPDILITSGRKSIAAARYIKKASRGKTFTVHLQDPRISPRHFDLLAVPEHDPARGPNVITTIAAPNRITPQILAEAKEKFAMFETLTQPRLAALIGGSSKAYALTPQVMESVAAQLQKLKAGLMVTSSRRTGEENREILAKALEGSESYIWNNEGENPYLGMLAWADYILVTADSVSMLSDAVSTGKPVYMITLEGGGGRLETLHNNLINARALRPFEGRLEQWTYTPPNDAGKIAAEIRRRLANRAGL